MSPQHPTGALPGCIPLDLAQARMLASAIPAPTLIANVEPGGLSVLAIDRLLRRMVTGATHPAGPSPHEVLPLHSFGMLASALEAAVADPLDVQIAEIPIGDEPQWFEFTVTAVADDDSCRQLIAIGVDTTTEHDIERQQRRSTRRLEVMVSNAPGLILLVDSAGRIIRASPGVERSIGLDARELVGRAIFETLHPDTLARAASMFNQLLSQPGIPVVLEDFRVGHVDGSYRWCQAVATNLLHDDDIAAIVFNAHDITDLRLAEQRLELLATSDALTGLPNRRRLTEAIHRAFADAAVEGVGVGLVIADLDDFKLVNDGLGHETGDAVLRGVAGRLERLAAEVATVARIGGDEFAVMIPHLEDPAQLDQLAEGIHEAIRSPLTIGDNEVFVRASIGTTHGLPTSAGAESLLRSADLALYRAKRNGRSQTVAFSAELQLEAEQRLQTITELQRALREGRLRLAYQPVVRSNGALVGAEALLRWEHDGKLLSPATFLSLAEDTGLILPIGSWVLNQACADIGRLRAEAPALAWVSVNLSSSQLLDQRLPVVIRRALENNGLDAQSLAVEVGESAVLHATAGHDVLQQLGETRVVLALDDITADKHMLHRLDGLAIDSIKVNSDLVQSLDLDPDGAARSLAAAILELALDKQVDVIAEGVETRAQLAVLKDLGFELFQGYLFSEPLDLASFLTRCS